MKPIKPLVLCGALSCALAATSVAAEAPALGSAPPATAPWTLSVVAGSVERYLVNPEGEVDGPLLSSGAQIKFPPHMAGELTAAVQLGDPVSVQGFPEYGGTVKAFAITNTRIRQAVVEHPPAWDAPRPPRYVREAALRPLNAEGTVRYLQYGKRGEVSGLLLDNGTLVRVPRGAAYQFPALLQVGQRIAASGYGSENTYGWALRAVAFGQSSETLQPIYNVPGGKKGKKGKRDRGAPTGYGPQPVSYATPPRG